MRYVLGIDQGGSKTHAIITDENGRVLGLGKSRGACHSAVGMDAAMSAVRDAAEDALTQSGIKKEEITVLSAGMTGVDWDYETALLRNALLESFPTGKVKVVNDCIIAMRAGTSKENSGILCAGSGLNCAVRKRDELFTYGFYIADEFQGGASLGMKAVQAVFDSHMGLIPHTALTGMLLQYFQCTSVDEVLYKKVMGKIKTRDYLALPMLLKQAAENGDEVALGIWENFGKAIAGYLTARMKKMNMLEEEADIILSGSIFKCRLKRFLNAVKNEIWEQAPKAAIIESIYEPIVGAALLGLDELFDRLPEAVEKELEKSAEGFSLKRLPGSR